MTVEKMPRRISTIDANMENWCEDSKTLRKLFLGGLFVQLRDPHNLLEDVVARTDVHTLQEKVFKVIAQMVRMAKVVESDDAAQRLAHPAGPAARLLGADRGAAHYVVLPEPDAWATGRSACRARASGAM